MARLVAAIAWAGLLGASALSGSPAVAQARASSQDFQIRGNDNPLPSGQTKFEFQLHVPQFNADPRSVMLKVTCSDGLTCVPATQMVALATGIAVPLTVTKSEGLTSADISAQLEIDNDTTLTAVRALDFGLWSAVVKVGHDAEQLVGGESRALHFWLEDAKGLKIRVTSTIQMEMSSLDGCVELKTANPKEKADAKAFGKSISTTINKWQEEAEGAIWIHPVLWTAGGCAVDIILRSGGIQTKRYKLPLQVKPSYLPAFLMSCAGAGIQYLLAGLMRIAAAARGGKVISFNGIFVGPNGVEIIETLLKGSFAFVLAFVLNRAEAEKATAQDALARSEKLLQQSQKMEAIGLLAGERQSDVGEDGSRCEHGAGSKGEGPGPPG